MIESWSHTFRAVALCLAALILTGGCQRDSTVMRLAATPPALPSDLGVLTGKQPLQDDLSPRLLRRFSAIHRAPTSAFPLIVKLGRMLYYEPRLSRTGKISCNSCHPLDRYGTTATKSSTGVNGAHGLRNAPTVYNASGLFAQFWDGRAATLDEQAGGPISNPNEMDMKPERAEQLLRDIPGYRTAFAQAFPNDAHPVTISHITQAIAEFERGLVTPARWDRYIEGDRTALSVEEKEGARLFANLGCMVCHTGAYVGGTAFEKLGVFAPWPNQRDHGRREVTHNPSDDMVFRVPSLRNVARTAPYFHDGSAATLDTAVRMMAHHQLGVDLTEDEARSIAAWLGSLTGELPVEYIAPPPLPLASRQ